MQQPGPLLASGRDSDIFEYGPGLVLRRSRAHHSMAIEARIMDYARGFSYPVPAVQEVSDDGTELIMERIDGPSMLTVLGRRPWALLHQAIVLARLHDRLHEIPAPGWIEDAPFGTGDRLVHLDLHPLNVLLSPKGPVVIDWPNASGGDGNSDVALTWVLLATAGIPAGRIERVIMGWGRSLLVRSFLGRFDVDPVRAQLPDAIDWKLSDPHMSEHERAAMRSLAPGSE